MASQGEAPQHRADASRAAPGASHRTPSLIAKALLATLLLGGAVAAGSWTLSQGAAPTSDDVSPSQAQMRLESFHALDALMLQRVQPDDQEKALHDMQLPPDALRSLRAALQTDSAANHASASQLPAAPANQASPQTQPDARRVQLVWVRLWDTDAEDGDVVRIESAGYTRTVRLTKRGDTFAVPVSADGVIRVTGIKDGDGGGITVGLASGASQAVFPIMSEGQVLGLKVRVE